MNKCKMCGKNCDGDYCFSHKPRKPFKTRYISGVDPYDKNSKGSSVGVSDGIVWTGSKKQIEHLQMVGVFTNIWLKRPHLSEVSDNYLGMEPLSAHFHHILPKSKYPELRLVEENIILLTLDEHANVESDMYKYEEVNKRRELLITKYKIK